jgi:molecular chaperone GrpE
MTSGGAGDNGVPAPGPEAMPEPKAGPAPAAEPDYFNQLLTLKAEFENYRKRVDRERPEYYKRGKAELLLKLLPIHDLLRRAHEQIQVSHAKSELAKGMEGIFREFEKIFKAEGASPMDALGKPYDARAHEVIGIVEKDDADEGTVVEVLENGFILNGDVLRTAKVRVVKQIAKREEKLK